MIISFFGDTHFDASWLNLLCHDPIHPNLNIINRLSVNRTIAVALEEGIPQFIVCIRIGNKLPKNMEEVLTDDQSSSKFDITNAVLYSIFRLPNCTIKGYGPKVIKAVLSQLKEKGVERVYTLSPIPMLSKYFAIKPSEGEVRSYLEKWIGPVEKFHLSNGARIQAINMNADASEIRQSESWGIMVNYDYNN
jgi:malonyl-CoA decarboxylase